MGPAQGLPTPAMEGVTTVTSGYTRAGEGLVSRRLWWGLPQHAHCPSTEKRIPPPSRGVGRRGHTGCWGLLSWSSGWGQDSADPMDVRGCPEDSKGREAPW